MQLVRSAAILVIATFALSALLTWIFIQLSKRIGLLANPTADRWHAVSTPNTGGIAIFTSCAIVCMIVGPGRYSCIAAAAAGIALLGFIDDRIRLRPVTKLIGQSLAAIAVVTCGVVFHASGSTLLNVGITLVWIVGITNAFNLIDNMDGLCAGVTIIICSFRFWSALQSGDAVGAALFAILAGGFLGFLTFNHKPAKIFMGDTGSMFAGFTLASLAIGGPMPQTRVFFSAILSPALTFLYPIFDTVLVSVLRKLAGRPISVGGCDHSSHRLASLGLEEKRTVWFLWALTALGGITGLLTYWMPLAVLAIAFFLFLGTTIFGIFLANLPGYASSKTITAPPFWIRKYIPTLRAGVILVVDTLIAGVALLVAFLLKWEGGLAGSRVAALLSALPIVMTCQAAACLGLRAFHLGWRWIGIGDLLAIGRYAVLSSGCSVMVAWAIAQQGYSLGIIVSYTLLLFSALAGSRLLMRIFWRLLESPHKNRRAALLCSSNTAELLILALRRDNDLDASAVLILDTNTARAGARVNGVPVLYAGPDCREMLRDASIELLIIPKAIDCLSPEECVIVEASTTLATRVLQFQWSFSPISLDIEKMEGLPMLSSSATASR